MTELLPCPFCGSDYPRVIETYSNMFYAKCDYCGVRGNIKSKRAVAERDWNERIPAVDHKTRPTAIVPSCWPAGAEFTSPLPDDFRSNSSSWPATFQAPYAPSRSGTTTEESSAVDKDSLMAERHASEAESSALRKALFASVEVVDKGFLKETDSKQETVDDHFPEVGKMVEDLPGRDDLSQSGNHIGDANKKADGHQEITPGSGGWIRWDGEGDCPISPDTLVDVIFSEGKPRTMVRAGGLCWRYLRPSGDVAPYITWYRPTRLAELQAEKKKAESAKASPTPDADGWIPHVPGDDMPCDESSLVNYICAYHLDGFATAEAKYIYWGRNGIGSSGKSDVIAWRHARPKQPKNTGTSEVQPTLESLQSQIEECFERIAQLRCALTDAPEFSAATKSKINGAF